MLPWLPYVEMSLSFLMESRLLKATHVALPLAPVLPLCLLKVLGNRLKFLSGSVAFFINHLTLTSLAPTVSISLGLQSRIRCEKPRRTRILAPPQTA